MTRVRGGVLLAAALLEVVAPFGTLVLGGGTPGAGGPDLLITPVGWAFAIWGPIYLLAIAQAVAVLRLGDDAVPRRLVADLLTLYLAGTAWILVAAAEISWATALLLVVMTVAGLDGVFTAARAALEPAWLRRLTLASTGLYAGWVTAAVYLNLSTAAVEAGLVDAGSVGWQLGVLVLAGLTVVAVTLALRGVLAYALAGVWAFAGIAVATAGDGERALLVTSVVGAVVVAVVAVVGLTTRPGAVRGTRPGSPAAG